MPDRHASGAEEMEASVFVDGGWYDGNLVDGPRDAADASHGGQRDRPPRRRSSSHHQRKQRQGIGVPAVSAAAAGGKRPAEDVWFSSPDSEDYRDTRESWHTAEWSDTRRSSSSLGSTPSGPSPAGSSPTRFHATTQLLNPYYLKTVF